MGRTYVNNYDYSVHVKHPDRIDVHEHKAPTDESIRLMEEMHDKALKNIIAKVTVTDNIVNGECFAIEQPWNMNDIKLIFKFKINGVEFVIEREVDRLLIGWDESRDIKRLYAAVSNSAKSIMLWYALRMFQKVAYEQLTNTEFPEELLK